MPQTPSIMIVNDEAITISLLKLLMVNMGYDVICTAVSGKDGVDLAQIHRPNLILMDIEMPGDPDGIEAARMITKTLDVPIIFLGSHVGGQFLERAKEIPSMGYILKPFRATEIQTSVEIALHRHQREQQVQHSNKSLQAACRELELRMGERDAIFKSVNDAIFTVDNELRVTGANEGAKTLCGIDPAGIIGACVHDVMMSCEKPCLEALAVTMTSGKNIREQHLECRYRNRPTKPVVLNSSLLTGTDKKGLGAVLVIRDLGRLNVAKPHAAQRHQYHSIIGRSKPMQKIYAQIENLADTEAGVLLLGESGTGKELIAKALHAGSSRADRPLIKVNCAALSENLLESELFGHVRGAFTGAVKDRIGRFQAADGGTILLDEIGDTSPAIQLKLLRILQEKEFEKVGEYRPIKVDVRVIAATNADLEERIRAGAFRRDLYYRLKVVEITLPPLRDRAEDIPMLIDHFLNILNKRYKKKIDIMSDDVLKCLTTYHWPGNIRELEHAIEHAFVMCRDDIITTADLPEKIREYVKESTPWDTSLKMPDREAIVQALRQSGWNKAKAARMLGIGRRTIYRKIDEYAISNGNEDPISHD